MEVGCNRLARSIGVDAYNYIEVLWLNADGTQEQIQNAPEIDSECGLAISKMFDTECNTCSNFMYGYWKILDNIERLNMQNGVSLLFDAMMPKPLSPDHVMKRWYEDFIELHRAIYHYRPGLYELDNYYTWGVMTRDQLGDKSERPFMNFVNGGNHEALEVSHLPLLKQFDLIFVSIDGYKKESHPNLRHHMYTNGLKMRKWTGGEPLLAQRKIEDFVNELFQREEILSILEKNPDIGEIHLDCSFCGGAYYMDREDTSRESSELYDKPSILSVVATSKCNIIFKNILEQPAMTDQVESRITTRCYWCLALM
ncbi:hypothetical protein SPFM1_00120 [Salmonella phage SPFM1]|nr:hypothetical protein SPFM1_00120 [Salmonella phage SPFM1]